MKTLVVSIERAEKNLSRLIQKVADGEEVIISRGPKQVARLVPIPEIKQRRKPGSMKGKLLVGPEFFEPLPADELF